MRIEENISLASHTTLRIGGAARYFCVVSTAAEALYALDFARNKRVSIFILGGGSNILVSDSGFDGLVIKNEIKGVDISDRGDSTVAVVGSGESWDGFVETCVSRGLWGTENLSLIPGTVGAAPVQNIGAYGSEVKDIVELVEAIDIRTGAARTFSNADCLFSYRESLFKTAEGKNFFITKVVFRLSIASRPNLSYKDLAALFKEKPSPSLREIRDAVINIRLGKFPDLSKAGTAGSFWKNPIVSVSVLEGLKSRYPGLPFFPSQDGNVKIPLAWILDMVCGLKGTSKGNVGLFKNQPLVLVAQNGATASDIDSFARDVESAVEAKTGIVIEREVGAIGRFLC